MKHASAPGYDLFKTIVAGILAVLLILMLLRGCATNSAAPTPTEIVVAPSASETLVPTPTRPVAGATQTPTSTREPAVIKPTITPSAPAATATEAPPTAPAQATPGQAQNTACNTIAPSRLSIGQTAQVVRRLNMRNAAAINAAILQTNPANMQVEIIGGPICTPLGDLAYLWWQIRLADGAEGWSAESPLNEASYFLEPIP